MYNWWKSDCYKIPEKVGEYVFSFHETPQFFSMTKSGSEQGQRNCFPTLFQQVLVTNKKWRKFRLRYWVEEKWFNHKTDTTCFTWEFIFRCWLCVDMLCESTSAARAFHRRRLRRPINLNKKLFHCLCAPAVHFGCLRDGWQDSLLATGSNSGRCLQVNKFPPAPVHLSPTDHLFMQSWKSGVPSNSAIYSSTAVNSAEIFTTLALRSQLARTTIWINSLRARTRLSVALREGVER